MLIIHHIHTHIYIFYFTRLIQDFASSDLHGRLAALGSLCPIHEFHSTSENKKEQQLLPKEYILFYAFKKSCKSFQ
jgi:hypothetical protein